MTIENSQANDEAHVRAIIEERVESVRNKDINALLSNHAPDILALDVLNPLQYTGLDKVRERAEKWLSSYQGSIGYEIRDLGITTSADVAFCHCLYRVSGTLRAGGEVNMWARATICLRKVDGKWMIEHEHQSVPFDVETGKASLDLKP